MAYRTYVGTTGKDTIQILGNNVSYKPLLDELKRQGVKMVDECFFEGKIKELQPIIDILEKYIMEEVKNAKINIFDMTPSENDVEKVGLTLCMMEALDRAYIFITANLINYLGDNIEQDYDIEQNRFIFKIKEGKEVWFEAY